MKLIVAVVHDKDRRKVTDALLEAGYKFTNIASTGGFLREGNVTYLIGVPPDQVDTVIDLIAANSRAREQFVNIFPPTIEPIGACMPSPVKVTVGGAVIFVVDVEKFKAV
jgi:uncharacterized protein YaaQ